MNHNLKKKKTSLFGKLYGLYVVIILVAIIATFFYVRGIMVTYEKSQPENLIMDMIDGAGDKDKSLGQYLQENVFAEDIPGDGEGRKTYFYQTDAYSQLTISKNLAKCVGDVLVYDVKANNDPFLTVAIKKVKTENKLGMLNIDTYELQYALLRSADSSKSSITLSDDGKYEFDITLPTDFKLLFDGGEVELSGGTKASLEDFSAVESLGIAPECTKLSFSLSFEPEIQILNNSGEEVAYSVNKTSYYANGDFAASDDAKKVVKNNCDALEIQELWARFMINEVEGEDNGLYNVIEDCRLMEGTDLYEKAVSWANNIDITFVTDHEDDWFEDEEVSNYVSYSNKLYSCDVSFTHVIYINQGGYVGNREVEYNTRMYFYRGSDDWYWVGSLDLTAR